MSIPENLKYSKEHEWVRVEGEVVVVGITEHAQDQLGDVVYVELPDVGAALAAEATFGTVESVKAVSDLFAPVAGEVVEVNAALMDTPELVNQDPYGKGWMLRIKPDSLESVEQLLTPSAYAELVAAG